MVFIEDGVYKVTREEALPSLCFIGSLENLRSYIDILIHKYGDKAKTAEDYCPGGNYDFKIEYVCDATDFEKQLYLKEQEDIKKKNQKKEKEERKLYEKLKKKYEIRVTK